MKMGGVAVLVVLVILGLVLIFARGLIFPMVDLDQKG